MIERRCHIITDSHSTRYPSSLVTLDTCIADINTHSRFGLQARFRNKKAETRSQNNAVANARSNAEANRVYRLPVISKVCCDAEY
ncbi:hypothetical protein GGP41_008670 [Bipolaris sorokiniana]|uniref:Uncharacterized protein n=1 Tax=Cochliobolus sativus TaxID=45130 RepID=A0A8H5Z8V5_COCSA|nr:hypothetical protein GGP41_008670 [Bipolaris sorokiniana]